MKRNIVITGATSGIGKEVAKHLAKSEINLFVLGRSKEKMEDLKSELIAINSMVEMHAIQCDFTSFASVREACDTVLERASFLDVLLLNAGVWNSEYVKTGDGIEETWQVNVLSQVYVFDVLFPLLQRNGESKVIWTSSGLHQGVINFEDVQFQNAFSSFGTYRQSKLALLLLSRLYSSKESTAGVAMYSVHPGMVRTSLGRNASWLSRTIFKLFGRSVKKGAATHVYLLDTPNSELENGAYYADAKVTKTTPYSYDMEIAQKLDNLVKASSPVH